MNLNFGRLKTLCLFSLTILAIYQTSRLWFEDDLSRNFFYSFLSSSNTTADVADEYAFVLPYRVLTNYGNNKFHVQYFSVLYEDQLKDATTERQRLDGYEVQHSQREKMEGIIGSVLAEGDYQGVYDLDYTQILSERSLIYEYGILMDSRVFAEIFPHRSGLPNVAYTFDMIVAAPDGTSSNLMKLYFINSHENTVYEYHLDSIGLCDELSKMIQDIQRANEFGRLYYVSSKLLKINSDYNFFFPRWEREAMNYAPAKIVTSYYNNNNPSKPQIQERIGWLFDNPSSVIDSINSGVYTFSDNNTVVKYYLENDMLEYRNYKISQQEANASLLEDFAKAIGFIRRDREAHQDFYLAAYEDDGNIRTFHFNYLVDSFPMVLYDTFRESNAIDYAMTVEIENNAVRRYVKLAYNFDTSEGQLVAADMDILDFIDRMESGGIKEVVVGYKASLANRAAEETRVLDADTYMKLSMVITTTDDNDLTWDISAGR